MSKFKPMNFLYFMVALSVFCFNLNLAGVTPNMTSSSPAVPSNPSSYDQSAVNQNQAQVPATNPVNPQLNPPNAATVTTPQKKLGSRAEQDELYKSLNK